MIPTPPISVTSSYLGGIESQRKVQYNNVLKKRREKEKKEIVNVMISFSDEKKCARERQQVERGDHWRTPSINSYLPLFDRPIIFLYREQISAGKAGKNLLGFII